MGHKVHPFIFRLGRTTNWSSRWFSQKNYQRLLKLDIKLQDFLKKRLGRVGLSAIEIERSANTLSLIIKTARPGLVIGRAGGGIEQLRQEIRQFLIKEDRQLAKIDVRLSVEEIKKPQSEAAVVAEEIASQIEKRLPCRRVIKQALDKIFQDQEVQGAKIMIKGRLNGAEIARREWLKKGKIPLQNLRAEISYAQSTAYTTYGTIGIKVWIYKGEKFDQVESKE